jgi:hypothetical protein
MNTPTFGAGSVDPGDPPQVVGNYCPKCGENFFSHDDDGGCVEKPKRQKWYVGYKKGGGAEAFASRETPREDTHGGWYFSVWGPFRTKRGAVFAATYRAEGFVSINEAERYAKRNP